MKIKRLPNGKFQSSSGKILTLKQVQAYYTQKNKKKKK